MTMRVSDERARDILHAYGFTVFMWTTCSFMNATHEVLVSDNRTLVGKGYQPIVAVAVWERRTDKMVARFNVVMP